MASTEDQGTAYLRARRPAPWRERKGQDKPGACARLGSARSAHVADGVLFLDAYPYVTGEILHIDSGQIAGH
jgi:hypothetical protein